MTSPLFQLAAAVARSAAATVPTALVVPPAEKPTQKSSQTAKQAALELAYDRSQAASAIIKAARAWREAVQNLDDRLRLSRSEAALSEAVYAYDALREED